MLVATFNAAKKKWNDVEAEEDDEKEQKDDDPYKDVLVEETQVVVKTLKKIASK